MATHGTIGEFQHAQEDWLAYVERLEQYFTANDVESADKQRAILLSSVGAPTYRLIRNLLAPAKPTDKTLKEIVDAAQAHHQPKPSVMVQRFNFHSRTRQSGETVSAFVAELRKLSEHCAFGDSLNDMLRDRLVCGINDPRLQRRLLAEMDITFAKAMELAQAAEAADRNARELEKAAPVHTVSAHDRPAKEGGARRTLNATCHRCGGKHLADRCRFKESDCHYCGKKGHLAKVCRSRLKGNATKGPRNQAPRSRGKTPNQTAHHIADEGDSPDATYTLFHIPGSRASPLVESLMVNNAKLSMEVDTGASASIISEETYEKSWPEADRPQLTPSTRKLRIFPKKFRAICARA